MLDDILSRLTSLPAAELNKLREDITKATIGRKFTPNPGAQTDAYLSSADVLLYGGAAGGGKSGLISGLALNEHERSLIMRRRLVDVGALTEDIVKLAGTRDGFVGGNRPKFRLSNNKLIEFGAAANLGDEESWQGQPHDLLAFDEAVQFLEYQVRFLMTWNRTVTPGQRCRTLLATNPPVSSQGQWIIGMFRPWLDITHSNPAKPGEIRWFVLDPDDKEMEVDGPEPILFPGETKSRRPKSRTFIAAKVADNPYLVGTDYEATLDSLPALLRSAMRDGNFMAAREDAADQVIPTAWVLAAQARWKSMPPIGVPMCAIGVDVASGGKDNTVLAPRHDGWFAPLQVVPGKQTPDGPSVAGLVVSCRRDGAVVVIDMGGGYGGSVFDHLRANEVNVQSYKGSEAATRRTKDKQLAFYNKRAQAYWQFREALDPSQPNGSPIALPDDPELLSDLTAPCFSIDARGIKITTKEDLVSSLGRSPDKGDAVVMSWQAGQRGLGGQAEWAKYTLNRPNARPPVLMKTRGARKK